MQEKYIILSIRRDGSLYGYLSSFSVGMMFFNQNESEAVQFDKIEDCIVNDWQSWDLGRDGGQGFYRIKKIIVQNPEVITSHEYNGKSIPILDENLMSNDINTFLENDKQGIITASNEAQINNDVDELVRQYNLLNYQQKLEFKNRILIWD
jgi:hypothetical protein